MVHVRRKTTVQMCTLALTAALCMAIPAGAQAKACPGATKTRFDLTQAKFASALGCLINKQRQKAGLPKLTANVALRGVATRHTNLMNRKHCRAPECRGEAPLGDRVRAAGYTTAREGALADLTSSYEESLEAGREAAFTPTFVVKSWLVGPTRRVMLDPEFTNFGAGVKFGSVWRRAGPGGRIHIRQLLMQVVLAGPVSTGS